MATRSLTPSPTTALYLQFLASLKKAKSLPLVPELSPDESALLDELTLYWHQGSPLAVREAMVLSKLGSPSTLHRRITSLKEKGLLQDQGVAANLRIKLLVPTAKALAMYERFARALKVSGQ